MMVGSGGLDDEDADEGEWGCREELMADANLEGSRRENARRGRGAREMEVREESVAPW
jgi:hypothetical protein